MLTNCYNNCLLFSFSQLHQTRRSSSSNASIHTMVRPQRWILSWSLCLAVPSRLQQQRSLLMMLSKLHLPPQEQLQKQPQNPPQPIVRLLPQLHIVQLRSKRAPIVRLSTKRPPTVRLRSERQLIVLCSSSTLLQPPRTTNHSTSSTFIGPSITPRSHRHSQTPWNRLWWTGPNTRLLLLFHLRWYFTKNLLSRNLSNRT